VPDILIMLVKMERIRCIGRSLHHGDPCRECYRSCHGWCAHL